MVVGARRVGWQGKVLGISVDEPQAHLQEMVAELANQTADRLGDTFTSDQMISWSIPITWAPVTA